MAGEVLDNRAADPARAPGNDGNVNLRGHFASEFSLAGGVTEPGEMEHAT
jgi:hypothetical protein